MYADVKQLEELLAEGLACTIQRQNLNHKSSLLAKALVHRESVRRSGKHIQQGEDKTQVPGNTKLRSPTPDKQNTRNNSGTLDSKMNWHRREETHKLNTIGGKG